MGRKGWFTHAGRARDRGLRREGMAMRTPFTGCGTALVTPFTGAGALDEAGVRRLGAPADRRRHALPRAVRHDRRDRRRSRRAERRRVVEIVVEEAKGRVPVLAGAGGYDTREVVEAAREMHAGRRRRPALGDAVLQQAHARGPVPALPGDRRGDAAADRRLQRARPHRLQRRRRDARASRHDPARRRRQGGLGQHDADVRDRAAPCRPTSSCSRATTR